jgi:hypothetical protein
MAEISNPVDELSPKQTRAIGALLVCKDIQTAAVEAGVGERTLHTWLRDANFQAVLRAAEADALTLAVRRLAGASGLALDVVIGIMEGSAPPAVRLRAALGLLDQLIKLRQFVDLEDRIAMLEERIQNEGEGGQM